ncbi:uncharacterized protein Z520_11332 [Fonsecaea multimorphosa CBS 102226]|uniref:Uncharacterized protein n=1 Tax=Fonsecaea multimorphosa CBS 102226 TaxID=1442371 RepID=A0A0D2JRI0_9EURO|nr:uncharacterized protein Z520_11332 [Fonsecaea multimorphosa CBS 102226]KIX93059.1 hypothetical protein Z520_11332 [Fonsecaea multimorphosa CBS 102226]
MTTAALQASTAPISLPPISSIDFHTQVAHRPEPEVVQPLPPPPPAPQRVLPPLPYPYAVRPAPAQVPPPPVPSETDASALDDGPEFDRCTSSTQSEGGEETDEDRMSNMPKEAHQALPALSIVFMSPARLLPTFPTHMG